MPGFSPTQGHIAPAISYPSHPVRNIRSDKLKNTMFLAKGSLFPGKMTQLADGMSFLLEGNGRAGNKNHD
jgi:betaine reductase